MPGPHPEAERLAAAALGSAVQPGPLAPDPRGARVRRHPDLPRARPRRRPHGPRPAVLPTRRSRSPSRSRRPTISTACSSRSPAAAPPSKRRSTYRVGERFHMSERLVVSPTAGLFEPHRHLGRADARAGRRRPLPGARSRSAASSGSSATPRSARPSPARSKGVLVLPGERVTTGQPVAWLRASTKESG